MVLNTHTTDVVVFFFQAEDGIRDLVRSRGLGDVYKRQVQSGLLIIALIVMAVNLIVDVLYAVINPRIRVQWLSLINI